MTNDTDKLIQEFLAKGGEIKKLPPKFEQCPTFLQINGGVTVKGTKPSGLSTTKL